MKKLAIIILSIVMIVACVAVVACETECTDHQWGEWEGEATCITGGELTRTCSVCHKQETRTVEVGEHKILAEDGSDVFCADVDFSVGAECSLCGELLVGEDLVGVIAHISPWPIKAVAATCTETGLTAGTKCLKCGNVLVAQEEVSALGHNVVAAPATVASCTENAYSAGTVCSRCGEYFSGHELLEEAWGHDFNHGNYFTYVECARNCGAYGVLTCKNTYETEFVYDFDATKKEEIDIIYNDIKAALSGASSVDNESFFALFEQYDDAVGYLQAQYQFGQILNDIEYSKETRAQYAEISEYYNTTVARYYTLFKEINESRYSEAFWAWAEFTEEDIAYVLDLANSYDPDNRNAADEIEQAYEELFIDKLKGSLSKATEAQLAELFSLYSQLVEANNNIATTAGYNNYMEYAYAEIYERDYGPDDVAEMRALVRDNIGPVLEKVSNAYDQWIANYKSNGWSNTTNQLFYSQFVNGAFWANPNKNLDNPEGLSMILNSRESVSDYFQFLSEGGETVNFYGELQSLFENGNYFLGANPNRTAYTWYVYSLKLPILLFTDDYRDAFTFIHEFGHYFQLAYNGRLSVPMDHDETQSQGNELLFLAWLKENMPKGISDGFEILETETLLNMLGSIIMGTAVDELEYLAYTGATEFNGKPLPTVTLADDTKVVDYATLFTSIMESYWEGITELFSTEYWAHVVFDSSAYYISYAMSALPCIELYAKAGNEGLAAARESYLRLFTFSSNDELVAEDSDGDLYVTATYQEILNWANLSGPFEASLYSTITNYFASR
ncbi:MAG: hypothetical protein J1F65_04535 [Clostridiales bacterium]|nr:hypothetical protein [Clostridiales bacterium]